MQAASVDSIYIENIECVGRLRQLRPEDVMTLRDSIAEVGLKTPITVRYCADRPGANGTEDSVLLVAGHHRLEAAKLLGWEKIDCFVLTDVTEDEARMWEIAENLHRADLTALERSEHVAEWVRLAEKQSSQVETKGHRPQSGVNKAARELNIDKNDAHRSAKVASLSDDAKDAARQAGLDDNRTALLAAAKEAPERQAARIVEIAQAKSSGQSKLDGDVKQRAARSLAEWIVEHANGNDLDAVKANLFTAGAKSIAIELTNLMGESIMDRRYANG